MTRPSSRLAEVIAIGGPPVTLAFGGVVEYAAIEPEGLIVYVEQDATEGSSMMAAVVAWSFTGVGAATAVEVTVQVTSFGGQGIIDGARTGHQKALDQLVDHFARNVAIAD